MNLSRFCLFAFVFAILSAASGAARAEPKPWVWGWWPWHWQENMFEPYLEDAKHPHNTQWDRVKWAPADWAAQRDNGAGEVIEGFYIAEILHGQYVDDGVPVLEVGPNFYHLSGFDKRRVTKMVDDYYQITARHENAIFSIHDWQTGKPIGIYTSHGLQIQ